MTHRTPDGETTYQVSGRGPSVVLSHGLGLNRQMWQWQMPALTPGFSVVTYDLLGHGDSARPDGPVDLTRLSDQVARLIDACDIERCALVGFSLGGMIARRFALDHGDRLWALAVLNSAHDRTESQRNAVSQRVEQARTAGPAATVDAALERWFTPAFTARHPDVPALVRQWVTANDPAVYPRIYRVLAEGDRELAEAVREIDCPTLVMTGEDDHGNSPDMARRLAGLIPGARLEILPGLRHMGLAEAPEAFNRPLSSFLRSASLDHRT